MRHRRVVVTIIILFLFAGCGLGVSDYQDAVLDGVSSLNLGRPEQALEDFNRAIDIDPTRADGFLGRANALNTLKRYEEALPDYNRAIEIEPTLANAYVNRGSAYSHLGQYEKAIADYEKGLELDPEIDDPPGFIKRLFSNEPNTDKGIRRHLEFLRRKVQEKESQS
jgi:tetratricopeptide (TPR) repeat protein